MYLTSSNTLNFSFNNIPSALKKKVSSFLPPLLVLLITKFRTDAPVPAHYFQVKTTSVITHLANLSDNIFTNNGTYVSERKNLALNKSV